jgi:mannose-6-phosphate isomerase-like protein (cupin superfamily)
MRLPLESMRIYDDTPDGGLKVGVAVDAESRGSKLAFGLKWIRPGTQRVSWRADAETYEAYFVQQGSLRVTWDGPDSGEAVVTTGECFYLPPGRSYSIENVGGDEVRGVWASTSPAADAPTA